MQKTFGAALGVLLLCGGVMTHAGEQPVVIELYTSQGCSSCPPADELVTELSRQPGVLPLALHVDYWDYIGWADQFADPDYTKRQKAYARATGQITIYTPQMVVGGVDHVVGNKPMQVMQLVQKHKDRPDRIDLGVTRTGDTVRITAPATADVEGPLVVQIVQFEPERTIEIERGENAGRTITYTNIVQAWETLGLWDPSGPLDVSSDMAPPAAVILQAPKAGPIVAAVRAD